MADIIINNDKCDNCGDCADVCPMEVLILEDEKLTIMNLMNVVTVKAVRTSVQMNVSLLNKL